MYHYVSMTERTPYVYCIGWLASSDISGCVVLGMESTLPGVFGSSNHSYSEHIHIPPRVRVYTMYREIRENPMYVSS